MVLVKCKSVLWPPFCFIFVILLICFCFICLFVCLCFGCLKCIQVWLKICKKKIVNKGSMMLYLVGLCLWRQKRQNGKQMREFILTIQFLGISHSLIVCLNMHSRPDACFKCDNIKFQITYFSRFGSVWFAMVTVLSIVWPRSLLLCPFHKKLRIWEEFFGFSQTDNPVPSCFVIHIDNLLVDIWNYMNSVT